MKGKRNAVAVFELLGLAEEEDGPEPNLVEVAACFGVALEAFRARDWGGARGGFQKCLSMKPGDGPAQYYLERIEELERSTLPEGWDAILDMEGGKWASQDGA